MDSIFVLDDMSRNSQKERMEEDITRSNSEDSVVINIRSELDLSEKLMENQEFMSRLSKAREDLRNCNYVSYEEIFGK